MDVLMTGTETAFLHLLAFAFWGIGLGLQTVWAFLAWAMVQLDLLHARPWSARTGHCFFFEDGRHILFVSFSDSWVPRVWLC